MDIYCIEIETPGKSDTVWSTISLSRQHGLINVDFQFFGIILNVEEKYITVLEDHVEIIKDDVEIFLTKDNSKEIKDALGKSLGGRAEKDTKFSLDPHVRKILLQTFNNEAPRKVANNNNPKKAKYKLDVQEYTNLSTDWQKEMFNQGINIGIMIFEKDGETQCDRDVFDLFPELEKMKLGSVYFDDSGFLALSTHYL